MCTESKRNGAAPAAAPSSPTSVVGGAGAAANAFNHHDDDQHEFVYRGKSCPHAARRREILAKYPEIEDLYGHDFRLVVWSAILVAIQVAAAIKAPTMSWPAFCLTAYFVGGTCSHALSLAGHEASHNLGFKKPLYNELLAIFCNLGQGVASGITFKRYHMEHHMYQGSDIDTDVPSSWEAHFFTTTPRKLIWLFLQLFFYALRPLLVNPKPLTKMEMINNVVVYGWDLFLVHNFGIWSALYFLFSLWCGMSFHPVAGHFISEHYLMNPDSVQETYSYYGPLNMLCFNVGYHNEHHDFPRVSGFNLPKVRAIAPEYYDGRWKVDAAGTPMAYHTSWVKVLVDYVTDPRIGPHSRVRREKKAAAAAENATKATKAE